MIKLRYSLILCLLVFAGCGYTTRAYIGPYKTIYVEPFKNKVNFATERSDFSRYLSYYPLLESTITQSVVDRFVFDGNLRVAKKEDADLVIKGELVSYDRQPLRYASNNEDVTEYRVNLWINLELYDKDGKQVWQKNNFVGDSTYFTTGSQTKSEKSALDDAISDLARRVVEAVVEAW